MKEILIAKFLFFLTIVTEGQSGFEFLSTSKSSMESLIRIFGSTIPDSTTTYKKYYLPIALSYAKAKASYDGYRGAMKDCIINGKNRKKIQQCLEGKAVNIRDQLDTMSYYLNLAYLEAYSLKIIKDDGPIIEGKNTGIITAEFIKGMIDTLLIGSLKIWDQIKKYKKEFKDSYLAHVASKEYDLSDIDQLIKASSVLKDVK